MALSLTYDETSASSAGVAPCHERECHSNPFPPFPCGADDYFRRAAYRGLFSGALDEKSLAELRLALNQDQPVGNDRFYREIEAMTGQRRELRKRGRPRKRDEPRSGKDCDQAELLL